ncbi:MAG: iron-sulfur cluster repair di-iron protein [Saprospiraceae bacterium]|jgi:regulator of cell morphogenesis and NO signaling|nr:iron-sulfur cluster repair di-iron protein [Lewinellaceae bacterium]
MQIHPELTVGELVAQDYQSAAIFNRYGIDFCCGGKKTLATACAEKSVAFEALSQDLEQALATTGLPAENAANWSPGFLAEYIVQTHHRYLRDALPFLIQYSTKIAQVHGARHPELKIVEKQVRLLAEDLMAHMAKEEQILFPYIKMLDAARREKAPVAPPPFRTVQNPIRMMEHEHESAGAILENLRELTQAFTPPQDACASYQVTFAKLNELDQDLRRHIHLENNVLFPKAMLLEQQFQNQN